MTLYFFINIDLIFSCEKILKMCVFMKKNRNERKPIVVNECLQVVAKKVQKADIKLHIPF